jgi:hypothetical protein
MEEQLNEECDQQMKDDEDEAEEEEPEVQVNVESGEDDGDEPDGDNYIEAMEGLDNDNGQSFVNRDDSMEEDGSSATEAEAELLLQLNRRRQASPELRPVPGVSYSESHESAVY